VHRVRQQLVVLAATLLPALAFVSEEVHANNRTHLARTTWDSVYSPEQAARGETTYTRTCERCHAASLSGKDEAPALTGGAFMGGWNGLTLFELHDRIRTTMPTDTPGTYSRQDIADVLAYMLKFNQFPAGKTALPTGDEDLKAITFVSAKPN
jgi:S-disulfanyl-L-cysteine oxidoreductase SoxD